MGLVCVLTLGVMGCSETSGAGGSGGSAGVGGEGGTGGAGGMVGEACVPLEFECESAEIEPIDEMCEIIVPDQANACDGNEGTENPTSCTPSGNTVTHKLTQMQVAPDCNAGFDLDGCYGETCRPIFTGSIVDGAQGVDNGFVWLDGLSLCNGCSPVELDPLDQALHDEICAGTMDIEIEVDAVPDEGCAVVRVYAAAVPGDPIPMNLSDDGCLSGTLGAIPIRLGTEQGTIENAVVRMTMSPTGFSDGLLGGTVTGSTAVMLLNALSPGLATLAEAVVDIQADLSGDSGVTCDSLSLSLEIGGEALR